MKLALMLAACTAAHAATCESLKTIALKDTTVAAETVSAGSFTPPGGGRGMPVSAAFCRVFGSIRPTPDSDIQFEVWMPASAWNGKFQGLGNGGFAGSIDYRSLAMLVSSGYAAAATDTGHRGGVTDAKWALHHPEKTIDFGYRAIHETAVKAKAILAAFYGDAPRRAYFSSCSNGGRQALMEAQRYPEDYDGIVAGAPANYWTHLLTAGAWETQAMSQPGAWTPRTKLPAIEAATLAACDALDGVKDGVIDDPTRCHFDPAALLCKGEESDECLTAPQVAAIGKVLSGPKTSAGQSIFPGKEPGGIPGANGWQDWITGTAAGFSLGAAFSNNFFSNMVFENPQWNNALLDFDRDPGVADKKLAAILNAVDPDLSRFQKRGGKLILYHGWSDAGIAPRNTVDYYNAVLKKMGAGTSASFVQLYMVPGMDHCSGGPGPNDFGQSSPGEGVNLAIEAWVEQGKAPAQLTASNKQGGKTITRPLCPYPQVAQWDRKGSTDEAASFVCRAQAR